jgi:hypothetical protein
MKRKIATTKRATVAKAKPDGLAPLIAEGWVTGTCTAISLGKTICVHEIVVTNDAGERLSTVRITNLLRDI